jgi:hypothetical protein
MKTNNRSNTLSDVEQEETNIKENLPKYLNNYQDPSNPNKFPNETKKSIIVQNE